VEALSIADMRRTIADEVVADYFRDTGQPSDMERDGAYQIQWTTVRRMLGRLEDVLRDAGFDPVLTRGILAAMLEDAPNARAADERIRELAEAVRDARERPARFIIDRGKDPELWAAAQKLAVRR
jgi:hypothetical protein